MPLQYTRYYTLPEARELLPKLREWFAELNEVTPRIHKAEKSFEPRLTAGEDLGGRGVVEWAKNLRRVHELLREFQSREIQLKDVERGLVDFPAILDEREVFLCWEKAEDNITHWHDIDTGFAGRKPLWEARED